MKKIFSIIVPVYNVEKYLRECLDSIFAQDFECFEVICINDASTDNSLSILKTYENTHPNLKLINLEQNGGLPHARNVGIEAAEGEYILFVDSDDLIVSQMLSVLWDEIRSDDIELLYFNMEIRDERTVIVEPRNKSEYKEYVGVYKGKNLFAEFYRHNQMKVECCRQLYKKSFVDKHGLRFYEGIVHEDNLFSFLCAMKAEKAKNLNKDLYVYRLRDGSIMSTIGVKRMESLVVVIGETLQYWRAHQKQMNMDDVMEGYLSGLVNMVFKYKNYYPNHSVLSVGTKADQFLYNLFAKVSDSPYEYIDITIEQLSQIKGYEKVIIFGAGTVGIEVMRFLLERGFTNFSFAVTNKKENPENVMNVKVYQLDELSDCFESVLFVIALLESKQRDVKEELTRKGVKNILLPNMKNS